ncbi:FAD-binding protein [Streptomyces zhihengii]
MVRGPRRQPAPARAAPRDEVARAINAEVKAGRGSPHGGVFLDVSTRMPAETVRRRLPSMYHQFKELADVDITAEPMEVGPTCHYVMGGIAVDSDTAAAAGVPGLFAAGEVAGGMHGSNRLGGNSSPTCSSSAAGPVCTPPHSPRRTRTGRRWTRRRWRRPPPRRWPLRRRDRHRGRPGEPVHPPPGAPADDERPGGDHPAGR